VILRRVGLFRQADTIRVWLRSQVAKAADCKSATRGFNSHRSLFKTPRDLVSDPLGVFLFGFCVGPFSIVRFLARIGLETVAWPRPFGGWLVGLESEPRLKRGGLSSLWMMGRGGDAF
jgi:hypothetical protein